MANYCCAIRTNYFKVKDAEAFKAFMERVYGSEDNVKVWEKVGPDGINRFGFGCYGGIGGLREKVPTKEDPYPDIEDEDDDDCDTYDAFIDELQKHIAEDDACLIFESGSEKLRYVVGSVTVVTAQDVKYVDIQQSGKALARAMLGNQNWDSKCEY